ncbi:guanitoxin biosynthesis heme-dependent pre-guanitoxin N-hydroxylase GntA [Streptomyces thermoalcalitolerans]|uniref:Guanitoxin biosynthesis heme-dependent pre-guanitoxin N-hydroxylase GntA n=1 Tax=Streptomyces thermoalcalitolerans TaxID=65605 RepID=A0ABP3YNX3_9ACTN
MTAVSVHDQLTAWIESEEFSCLGAKSALHRGSLRQAHVGVMGTESATTALHGALTEFVSRDLHPEQNFATLVAVFEGPLGLSEPEFHTLLWKQLSALHAFDADRGFAWAEGADPDPDSPRFGFSVAGHPFFVVGLHENASRITRRFPYPAMAFNSHHQFRRLVENGVYAKLQHRIREREMRLQGSINPNLAEFGEASEARQYSGMPTDEQWRCPFAPRTTTPRTPSAAGSETTTRRSDA